MNSSNLDSIFNVVIGTAGHIDHGKSSLVERLTGVDPDRLPEEKKRGLTIDLGFAPMTLRSGLRVGIIDVPGHERLIKNMVAGATGIDLVILVVAADDGVMPQTEEHVSIVELLGIQHGLIAITKIDTVENELRELVRDDIKQSLSGTFLKDAPIVEVSSVTGEGIDTLLEELHRLLDEVSPRDTTGVFRMPIQRVFSAKGFGTVVTGVPLNGHARVGSTLEVVPLGQKGRIRGIHAYKESTDLARAGHSSAINLTDVDYREVQRGMVLTEPGYFEAATMFEARLDYLASNKKPLRHQMPIRLHLGTAEGLGRVYLLERKVLEPGACSFVQFRLDDPIVASPGDRFVIRSYSPAVTIGGGEILDRSRWRLKTGKQYVLDELKGKADALNDVERLIMNAVNAAGYDAVSEKDLSLRVGLAPEEAQERIAGLIEAGKLRKASRAGLIISSEKLENGKRHTLRMATDFFTSHPYQLTMEKALLRQALSCHESFFDELLNELSQDATIVDMRSGRLRFRDFTPKLSSEEERIKAALSEALRTQLFTPPAPADVGAAEGWDPKAVEGLVSLLEEEGEFVRVDDGIVLHREAIDTAKERLGAYLTEHEGITASDAKNVLQSTRKYSIPLLEHLDQIGFTIRRGDQRQLRRGNG